MNLFKNFKDNLKKAKEDFNKDLEEYREEKAKNKKHKKEWHIFKCEVKGHFLHERQRVLSRAYRDSYDPEIEHDETSLYDIVELIPEPENEYDENAIKVELRSYGQIGYIPKDQVQELKETINLDEKFKSYLTIYKDAKEYFADLEVHQKY